MSRERAGAPALGPETAPADALARFALWERLEVGPVILEPDRLKAPYRVSREGEQQSFELIYRYEEPVFDPSAPADRNLASMIAAQVAVNYGLFTREMVFVGDYDETDRRFLETMLEKTSREILVKKLLEPNPFLLPGWAAALPARREKYLRATVRFEGAGEAGSAAGGWAVSPDRWGVLSSGGKDSLLSFGLLDRLGCRPQPIFVNESGRHWFTALNAYRRLREAVPGTGRVWTNCDRLFSFLLRQLPFVRPDFQEVRSDEYPIRLWTVAVFLFGALPIFRKRGLGRLVVGNEYDTTAPASFQGIRHYDGLFDQSVFFDRALTVYYRRKGWGLTQFSLLRPLSELLIQKTLATGFPDLLGLQVSCHAAHTEDGVVRPCGRCEKCRRIVSMLLAVDADPAACGYSPSMVAEIRRAVVERGVHQERPAVEELGHLLDERALIARPQLGSVRARHRPEILQLRLHAERSPLAEIPSPIRAQLLQLMLQWADGAVRRVGRVWLPVDLETDSEVVHPYPFDRPRRGAPTTVPGGSGAAYRWGELSWPEAERCLRGVDLALLPVGAVEQHGPHLPLDTDAFDAELLAERVAVACSVPRPLVLPLIPYGVSYHHEDFPGTVSVSNETLARLVYEVGMGAARNGISKLVIVNGHGGNGPTLHFAAQMINRDARIFTCVDSGETSDADVRELVDTVNDVHAGEVETSTSLAVRPELVKMDAAKRFVPRFSSQYLDFESKRSVEWYARTANISRHGVFGDPTRASAEKGERIWQLMVDRLVELVEHLKSLSLAEIHERRT